ncbi:hypothetical protein MIR68_010226 [Amoeboaphelidium protococcarum]|nr:hypothetical protein MIR68_010226 [Amoeboaphelidium protococcarum]
MGWKVSQHGVLCSVLNKSCLTPSASHQLSETVSFWWSPSSGLALVDGARAGSLVLASAMAAAEALLAILWDRSYPVESSFLMQWLVRRQFGAKKRIKNSKSHLGIQEWLQTQKGGSCTDWQI